MDSDPHVDFLHNHISTIEEDYEGEQLTSEMMTNTQGNSKATSTKRKYNIASSSGVRNDTPK
jgi:hypothetical protein